MENKLFALLSLFCMITASLQQNCCPVNYSLHVTNSLAICIRYVNTPATYNNALAVCSSVAGGSLIKVDPRSEVESILGDFTITFPSWIGLNPNDYTWIADGTTPSEFYWSGDQTPQVGSCVRVNDTSYRWSAVSCDATAMSSICQAPVDCSDSSCEQMVSLERCPCSAGFEKDASSLCVDVDECASSPSVCNDDLLSECVNTPGSYECVCRIGTTRPSGGGMCTEHLCTTNNDCSGIMECTETNGVRQCQCPVGLTGQDCNDIDECVCSGPPDDQCFEVCQPGGQQCERTKCAGANEVCANTESSFTCNCASGYERTFNNFCQDIDECAAGMCVGERQTCENTAGSFTCTCDPGYDLVNDVCEESCTNRCDPITETCVDSTPPVCQCRAGYFMSDIVCRDVDECGSTTTCDGNANTVCVNTPGSFVCQCRDGYQEVDQACTDINECTAGTHDCRTTAECTNTIGSFNCACLENEGFFNGLCTALRDFRVKIIATELNDTVTTYQSAMDPIYRSHFCTIITDIVSVPYPNTVFECSPLRFGSGSVRGYLLLRTTTALSAVLIEDALESNVVTDLTGEMRLLSNSRDLSLSLTNPESSIDVEDIALYNGDVNACDPSPCQNNAACVEDREVYDVSCICPSGFSGEVCEISDDNQPSVTTVATTAAASSQLSTVFIVVISVSAFIFAILFLVLCCCCCYVFFFQGGLGSPATPGPPFGAAPVVPYRGPPSTVGYGRGQYYEANSVI